MFTGFMPLIYLFWAAIAFFAGRAWLRRRRSDNETADQGAGIDDADDPADPQVGDMRLKSGNNWQCLCPDCGSFNVFHRPAGITCRGCDADLLVVPEKGEAPLSVVALVSQASSTKIAWLCTNRRVAPNATPYWSAAVFSDLPEPKPTEVNPRTDLDWPRVSAYMPIICPTCEADHMADCADCLRTGVRFVPLATWRGEQYTRVSAAGLRRLAGFYGERLGLDVGDDGPLVSTRGLDKQDEGVALHQHHTGPARRGYGPLVLEGRRYPAEIPDDFDRAGRPPRKP